MVEQEKQHTTMHPAAAHLRRAGAAMLTALALLSVRELAQAQEQPAVVKRATELRESSGDSGRVLAPLPAGSAVTRTGERQGPWVHVRTAGNETGWVHLFDIKSPSGAANGGSVLTGALRGVQSLFAKPNERVTTPTATIGIRGLSAEDIANAQPDETAAKNLQALRSSENDAREFAREASISPVQVDPLPMSFRARVSTPQEN